MKRKFSLILRQYGIRYELSILKNKFRQIFLLQQGYKVIRGLIRAV
jgi:hypothetical protein